MEKKPIQTSKTPPKETKDKPDDLKSQFITKSSSVDWANILLKRFCEETVYYI
jgi:hypothetical protein